jgi:hypothetical protein
VAVVAEDPQKQLEWEARQRPRAGIAAIVAVLTMLGGLIGTVQLGNDVPNPSGIETLQRAVKPGPVDQLPTLQIAALEYLTDHQAAWLLLGVLGMIGAIAGGWSMGFLAVATRARRPELRRWVVYLPIVGGVLAGLAFFLREVAQLVHANQVLDGPRTVAEATNIGGLLIFASALGFFGQLATAGGYVLVSLHAMRAGLLTRLLGTLGIGAGVFTILPILPFGPLLQLLLQAALALMFFRLWMGGIPPAWESGRAEPWPSRKPLPPTPPAPQPAGPAPAPAAAAAAPRSKRKKRH